MRLVWIWLWGLLMSAWAAPVEVTFTYDPPATLEVNSVSLRGSFNNWAELPMQKQENGTWAAKVSLEPGSVQYKFFINGAWPTNMCEDEQLGTPQVDAEAEGCTDDGQGGQNAVRTVGASDPSPSDPAEALGFEHDPSKAVFVSQVGNRLSLRFKLASGAIQSGVVEAGEAYPVRRQLSTEGGEVWRASVLSSVRRYSVRVRTQDGQLQSFGPFEVPQTVFKALDWVGGRVGYQIFLDRFWNGDPGNDAKALQNTQARFDKTWSGQPPYRSKWTAPPGAYHCCQQYYGGDLAGFLQKLPHLKSLGVNLIYFNPLFDSGSAHGYDTHDYLAVSPKFGDKALLNKALEQAHRLGMKVIFDFVPNHTGLGFAAFQDVAKKGRDSKYWNWYLIKKFPFVAGDGNAYEGFFGLGSLPKLNTANPEVREYLYTVAETWLRFGFDGLRIDYPQGVIGAETFYPELRRRVRALKPDAYIVGEIWNVDPSWLQGNMFDSLMNYPAGVGDGTNLSGAVAFAKSGPAGSAKRIAGDLARIYASYPEAVAAMNFNMYDSHDMERVLTRLGGGNFGQRPSEDSLMRLELATAILYALPGASVVFQGDECGINGQKAQWPINELYRYPVQWDRCNPRSLKAFQILGQLRLKLPAFKSALYRSQPSEGSVLAFGRGEVGTGEVLAVFNNGSASAYQLPAGRWKDALEGKTYQGWVQLGALRWRYLERLP